jgi:hypothetical protein
VPVVVGIRVWSLVPEHCTFISTLCAAWKSGVIENLRGCFDMLVWDNECGELYEGLVGLELNMSETGEEGLGYSRRLTLVHPAQRVPARPI